MREFISARGIARISLAVGVTALVAGVFVVTAAAQQVPLITMDSPTPFFTMGSQIGGLGQVTSGGFTATDGVTSYDRYDVSAAISGTTDMGGMPTVSAHIDGSVTNGTSVVFRVRVTADPGQVNFPTSSATVVVTVTSQDTSLSGNYQFVVSTQQDLDRP